MKTWFCRIGETDGRNLPKGADAPMRKAVKEAYFALTGEEDVFLFSGWDARLTEEERAVVENRDPRPSAAAGVAQVGNAPRAGAQAMTTPAITPKTQVARIAERFGGEVLAGVLDTVRDLAAAYRASEKDAGRWRFLRQYARIEINYGEVVDLAEGSHPGTELRNDVSIDAAIKDAASDAAAVTAKTVPHELSVFTTEPK